MMHSPGVVGRAHVVYLRLSTNRLHGEKEGVRDGTMEISHKNVFLSTFSCSSLCLLEENRYSIAFEKNIPKRF